MGRFASTVPFYRRYREPYPTAFFRAVEERLGLNGEQRLIDLGCGPAILAIGFAPYVRSVIGVDPEPEMIDAARAAAAEAGIQLELIPGHMEDLPPAIGTFDVVTIGRALHWMSREAAPRVLDRLVASDGSILVCGAPNSNSPINQWVEPYDRMRRSWASDPQEHCYHIDVENWFANSRFRVVDTIRVAHSRQVTIPDLVGRALSKSNTSPAVLGSRRTAFEAAITDVLAPFAPNGFLEEEIEALATVVR